MEIRKGLCIAAAILMIVMCLALASALQPKTVHLIRTQMYGYEMPIKCTIPDGAYGVWQIPEIDVSVPVYQTSSGQAQPIVDRENSAAIYRFYIGREIADHAESVSNNGRGVWRLNEVHVDGAAFLITGEKTEYYRCYMIVRANVNRNSYTAGHFSIYPRSQTDIMCAGCATEDATENYIALYRYIGAIP